MVDGDSLPQEAPSTSAANDASASLSPATTRQSCVPFFDALWFCYSPAHQLRQYYVYGTVDDCTGHWGALWDCLKQRTRFKDEGGDGGGDVAPAHPLWRLRTPEEAREAWQREFGGQKRLGKEPEGEAGIV
jgi:hypothetical protein